MANLGSGDKKLGPQVPEKPRSVEDKSKTPDGAHLFSGFKATSEAVQKRFTDEIVIVLCGPIGSPMHRVADRLKQLLEDQFAYETTVIRLSRFIEEHAKKAGTQIPSNGYDRLSTLINLGNDLRQNFGRSYLVEKAIAEIAKYRDEKGVINVDGLPKFKPMRVCHIIDSIKNLDELNLLRDVYGSILFCVGVFSPLSERQNQLERRDMKLPQVFELIDRDSGEEIATGQRVKDVFHRADFFLRIDENSEGVLDQKLVRFIKILLDVSIVTPSIEETAMYLAASAACKSACLSRQVGAAITDFSGKLLAVGWNDVPSFGGGLYGSQINSDASDHRCMAWQEGVCHNDKQKDEVAKVIASELSKAGYLNSDNLDRAVKVIRESRVGALIEFSRSVHAEMHALINAGSVGAGSLKGAKLFCTTYPCHSCARHLIAAGVHEVYFIEPYSKSLAVKLHQDSISEDERSKDKMRLLAFEGVAPKRYKELFEMRSPRKEDGVLIAGNQRSAKIKGPNRLEGFPVLESLVVGELKKKLNLGVNNEENSTSENSKHHAA